MSKIPPSLRVRLRLLVAGFLSFLFSVWLYFVNDETTPSDCAAGRSRTPRCEPPATSGSPRGCSTRSSAKRSRPMTGSSHLDLSECAVDGSQHKAHCDGAGAGKNPTDRRRLGWKWSLLCDRNGIPLGRAIGGANRYDITLVGATFDAADDQVLLDDIETLHLDRGYDNGVTRAAVADAGITDLVCAKRRSVGIRATSKSEDDQTESRLPLGHGFPAGRLRSDGTSARASSSASCTGPPPGADLGTRRALAAVR
jgi:hypothetical protein